MSVEGAFLNTVSQLKVALYYSMALNFVVNLGKVALETHALLQIDFVMKHACHSVTI
jgi:hypothetical protein